MATELEQAAPGGTSTNAWDRRQDETDRDWGLFVLYRDLHPSVRSAAKAYALYQQQKAESDPALDAESVRAQLVLQYKAPPWVERVCTRNDWVSRVRAFDEWRDRDQLERLQSTRVRSLSETAGIGRELRQKAQEALRHLRVVAYENVLGPDGEPTTIVVSTLSPSSIVALAKAGTDLERIAIGLQQSGGGPGVQVQIANIMGTGAGGHIPIPGTDEQLMEKVLEVAKARGVIIDQAALPAETSPTDNSKGANDTRPSAPGELVPNHPEDG